MNTTFQTFALPSTTTTTPRFLKLAKQTDNVAAPFPTLSNTINIIINLKKGRQRMSTEILFGLKDYTVVRGVRLNDEFRPPPP